MSVESDTCREGGLARGAQLNALCTGGATGSEKKHKIYDFQGKVSPKN